MSSNEQLNELMLKWIDGDRDAFALLYEQLYAPIYQFIFRYTRNKELSIDIVQDTFVHIHKKKQLFDSRKGNVKTFLFRIAYHLLLNKLKRRKRFYSLLPFLAPAANFEEHREDDRLSLELAISKLSSEQRAVILLAYYEDMSREEIASTLNIPIGTVKSRLYHAIQKLKKELKLNGETTF